MIPFKPKTLRALKWINSIMKKHHAPFEVWGGFDARLFGAWRSLADIDIFTHKKKLYEIYPEIKNHIIYGPRIYQYKPFHLFIITLNYRGQEIDLCGLENLKLYDKFRKKWFEEKIDFRKANSVNVSGIKLKAMPLKELIKYKKRIARRVDLEDIRELTNR
jgi:hypothetical protein